METYVTQPEFEFVVKELKRLQSFLSETFGSKFLDFKCKDELVEHQKRFGPKSGKNSTVSGNGDTDKNSNAVLKKGRVSFEPLLEVDDLSTSVPVFTSTKSLQQSHAQKCNAAENVGSRSRSSLPSVTRNTKTINVPGFYEENTIRIPSSQITQRKVNLNKQGSTGQTQQLKQGPPISINLSSARVLQQASKESKTCKPPAAKDKSMIRGRTAHHKPALLSSTRKNTSSDRDIATSSNESEPIVMGIASEEEIPTPPKRSRLPSFKNRSLGMQSSRQSLTSARNPGSTPPASRDNDGEIIQCELCSLFVYSSQVDSHMKNHSLVEGKLAEKEQLNPLMKKPQVCPICNVESVDFHMYEQHCIENHPDDGFPCPVCSRRTNSKPKLKRHMSIHRNLKFECNVCGKAYNRSDNLSAHYKTHGNNEEVNVFYCSVCNMAFSSKTGRDRHAGIAHPKERKSRSCTPPNYSQESSESSSSPCGSSPDDPDLIETSETTVETIKIEDDVSMGSESEFEGEDDHGL